MIAPPKPDLVTVNVDGKDIAVPKGTNMIEAARLASVEVPHYCYHPKLTVAGKTRWLPKMSASTARRGSGTPTTPTFGSIVANG